MDANTNTPVTRDEALAAIGKVWAGNAGDDLWRAFNAGDYAKARDIAARKVAEQDAHEQQIRMLDAGQPDGARKLPRR